MPAERPPFIYISAMRRSGSTLLSEAFTKLPYAYIFQEPNLGKNIFHFKSHEAEILREYSVDLDRFTRLRRPFAFVLRRLRQRPDYAIHAVKTKLLSMMFADVPAQIGVKEIRNEGWEHYLRHFPDMRVVMTGRDPRDIYLSACERNKVLQSPIDYEPVSYAKWMNDDFAHQLALSQATECFRVRYEDLCSDPLLYAEVKRFVESPIPEVGEIGRFLSTHAHRQAEHEKHGGTISTKSVGRWRKEKNQKWLAEAHKVFELVPEYNEFWGYK